MRIARVEVGPFRPRLAGRGFAVSYGRLTALDHRLIRLTTDTGLAGLGEVVRLPARPTDEAAAVEDRLLPTVRDIALADLPALVARFRAEGAAARGLCFALETALLDIVGQASGMPLSTLLGGPASGDVPALAGISCETPAEMAADLAAAEGAGMIQIKLGVGAIETDLSRLEASLTALRPGQRLFADFNGILPFNVAISTLPGIAHPALVWEEPCKSLAENLALARRLAAPLLLDQCLDRIEAYRLALADGGAAALSVKPFYLGGLSVARTVRDICAAAEMPMRIDGPWCGQVGSAAILHLALGAPPELLWFSAYLTGPLEAGREMIRHPAPGRVAPRPGPGFGPHPADLPAMADA